MKVYILSDHDEDGSKSVMATLDKNKLPKMLSRLSQPSFYNTESNLAGLAKLVDKDEIDINGTSLSSGPGWGGAMLHIVDLS